MPTTRFGILTPRAARTPSTRSWPTRSSLSPAWSSWASLTLPILLCWPATASPDFGRAAAWAIVCGSAKSSPNMPNARRGSPSSGWTASRSVVAAGSRSSSRTAVPARRRWPACGSILPTGSPCSRSATRRLPSRWPSATLPAKWPVASPCRTAGSASYAAHYASRGMRSRARSPPRPSRDLSHPKLTIRRGLFKKIGSPTLKLNPLDRRESSVTISQGDKTMLQTSEPEPTSLSSTGVSGPQRGRASWTGILQVSLVAVPVKAYPATSTTEALRFNQLHAGCKQRIRYEKHCPSHGKVEAAEIVKGYPYAPDQYVVVEDSELDRLRPPKEKALLLEQFVEAGQVEPVRLSGRTLYLFPQDRK